MEPQDITCPTQVKLPAPDNSLHKHWTHGARSLFACHKETYAYLDNLVSRCLRKENFSLKEVKAVGRKCVATPEAVGGCVDG
eukprot:g40653.t1